LLVPGKLTLGAVEFFQDGLSGVGAIPEIGLAGLVEQFFLACGEFSDVKDASRGFRRGLRNRSVVHASR
jgi:hypothetical protein